VANVVSSTLVPGRYRRSAWYGTAGQRRKLPPVSGSSSAANTGGESIAGTAHQSTVPSAATSASDRPSPMTPYPPIGAKASVRTPSALILAIRSSAEFSSRHDIYDWCLYPADAGL
jgi:hypothetical protein